MIYSTNDTSFSISIVLSNGQSNSVILYGPAYTITKYPKVYKSGGYMKIVGTYLSFDPNVISFVVNGNNLTLYSGSSTELIFKYGELPTGSVSSMFTQGGIAKDQVLVVSSIPQCTGLSPYNGICLDGVSVCLNAWTGPTCQSLSANFTQPSWGPNPNISTQNYINSDFNLDTLPVRYSKYLVGIQELNNLNLVLRYFEFSNWIYTNISSTKTIYYIEGFQTENPTSNISVIVEYYPSPTSKYIQSTLSYIVQVNGYTLNSTTNHLGLVYGSNFETSQTVGICSSSNIQILQSDKSFYYSQLKLNYVSLYNRFSMKYISGGIEFNGASFSHDALQQTAYSIVEIAISLFPQNVNSFEYNFDFNVLYNIDSASGDSNKICIPKPPVIVPCKGTPECGGSDHGLCKSGKCECILPWAGEMCDSVRGPIPDPEPNPTQPSINSTTDDQVQLHISIVSIRELDYNGNEIRNVPLGNWTLKQSKTDQKQTYFYQTSLFDGNSEVKVTIDYFYKDTVVSFANQNSTKLAGSIKCSANITTWPFTLKTNQLQILFASSIKDQNESSESCSYKSIEYNQQDGVENVFIQINDKTFSIKFSELSVVDGVVRVIKNQVVPNTIQDTNTETSSLIGVNTPYHNYYAVLDPDFNLLVSYVSPDEKEGSICSSNSKYASGLTKAQLAGIIAASSFAVEFHRWSEIPRTTKKNKISFRKTHIKKKSNHNIKSQYLKMKIYILILIFFCILCSNAQITISLWSPGKIFSTITGNGFNSNSSALVKVGGIVAPVQSATDTEIILNFDGRKYVMNDTSFSIIIDIGIYALSQVFSGPPYQITTFPPIYTQGGYVKLIGNYLSFDPSLISFSINGQVTTLYSGTSTYLIFLYSATPAGYVTSNFIQNGVYKSQTLSVLDQVPCGGISSAFAICVNGNLICLDQRTGPLCESISANFTQSTWSNTLPTINSTVVTSNFNGNQLPVKYTLIPTSISEWTLESVLVRTYNLNSLVWTVSPINALANYYLNSDFQGPGSPSSIGILLTYTAVDADATYGTTPVNLQQATMTTTITINNYSYLNTSNYIVIQFTTTFDSPGSTNICGSVLYGELPTSVDTFQYSQQQFNYVSLFSRFFKKFLNKDSVESGLSFINQEHDPTTPNTIKKYTNIYFPPNTTILTYFMDSIILYNWVSASTAASAVCKNESIPTPPVNVPCKGTPECGGSDHGQCVSGKCECVSPWTGETCDSVRGPIPEPEPNPTQPTINSTDDKIQLHISIVSIRELGFNGNEIRNVPIGNWTLTQSKSVEKISYIYETSLFSNSCKILVNVDYFYKDTVVSFANQNSTKLAGSIKYSANITTWPFTLKTNQLQVLFASSIKDQDESSESCSYKSIEYNQQDGVENVFIQVNDRTFTTKFSNLSVVDGVVRLIKNQLLPNFINDSNTQSNVLVGVNTPYHNYYVLIDPDFNLLVSYVSPDEKEGSICGTSSSKSKLTKAQIAGIIVGSVVAFLCIVIILVYFLTKSLTFKILLHKTKILKMPNK
ncbi:hypothetical protein DLAC_05003 [Tieghemostelium lacteum]|uniref:EGF-like domain-containing protein n=1 Tax=Tieghemostelium lacteum TaxID=361077 RepID=A0A151ZHZ7_TIELA|nr:hypothetical protein DLAC_05003 [Tieghemostelium lacteum]|eukprot:KYQ93621.1 hypothetical protein DLAC_05003 [Tieghemostelium lacteum]